MRSNSIILLSDFCSGSTALQSELIKSCEIRRSHVIETQYWCMAAALLKMPQPRIMSSILPMSFTDARAKLTQFLSENLKNYTPPDDSEVLIFDGWKRLCDAYFPFFFEKSPHHLHYKSALQLIHESIQKIDNVEFKFIGLIRNPLDTIYSRWRQWRNNPDKAQWLWYHAYNNLFDFEKLVGERLFVCKYEDLVTDERALSNIFKFLGAQQSKKTTSELHAGSIGRWRKDPHFAFQLDSTITQFAESIGYKLEELQGRKSLIWPLYRQFKKTKYYIGDLKRFFTKKKGKEPSI